MQQNRMGSNIIITEPSSNLRALGRNALAGKWKVSILAVLVYTLCLQIPSAILDALFGTKIGSSNEEVFYNIGADTYNLYNGLPETSLLGDAYVILVTGALELGITLFFLATFRRQLVYVTDIFLGFERFGKALGLLLFQLLFIALWSLLFLIPGIVAAIKYSQAFFILADDPNKSIRQCMNESKMMMKGNKGKYFVLSLSFIGWMILASLPGAVLDGISSLLYLTGFADVLVTIIGGLFVVPVTVYMYSTYAGFYEILAGHLIKETEPAPLTPQDLPFPLSDTDLLQQEESTTPKMVGTPVEAPTETSAEPASESATEPLVEEPSEPATEPLVEEPSETPAEPALDPLTEAFAEPDAVLKTPVLPEETESDDTETGIPQENDSEATVPQKPVASLNIRDFIPREVDDSDQNRG